MTSILTWLARRRVPLGFLCAVVAFATAKPTTQSIVAGAIVAVPGELLRLWASGHLHKGREITRSGPYRFVRHPLYLGSAILGLAFIVASHSVVAGVVAAIYLAVTLAAAIRSEEAGLDRKFAGEYAAYREGLAAPVDRPFRIERVIANREYRAAVGVVIAFGLLVLRARF